MLRVAFKLHRPPGIGLPHRRLRVSAEGHGGGVPARDSLNFPLRAFDIGKRAFVGLDCRSREPGQSQGSRHGPQQRSPVEIAQQARRGRQLLGKGRRELRFACNLLDAAPERASGAA